MPLSTHKGHPGRRDQSALTRKSGSLPSGRRSLGRVSLLGRVFRTGDAFRVLLCAGVFRLITISTQFVFEPEAVCLVMCGYY